MKRLLILLDSGHGGMVKKDGIFIYTTAPDKMYKHLDGTIAYEGVINRKIKNRLIALLEDEGIAYVDVSSGQLDLALDLRVNYANMLNNRFKKLFDVIIYLAIHLNASPQHNASGFEVWTTEGKTISDEYGQILAKEIKKEFIGWDFRSDVVDGDLDKESNFYVLRNTNMPAVLSENLFFDLEKDWEFIKTQEYIDRVAKVHYRFIQKIMEGN